MTAAGTAVICSPFSGGTRSGSGQLGSCGCSVSTRELLGTTPDAADSNARSTMLVVMTHRSLEIEFCVTPCVGSL
eukprot:3727770-Pyramimonas_sp.AAC.1